MTASTRALFCAVLTPVTLTAVGLGILDTDRVAGTVWLGAATFLAIVAATDHPIRTRLDHDGVHRHCLLRRHDLAWEQVAAFQLTRGGSLCLVATSGRRYLVGDRGESLEPLRDAVNGLCPSVVVRAARVLSCD